MKNLERGEPCGDCVEANGKWFCDMNCGPVDYKAAVLNAWPNAKAAYNNCGMGGSYWSISVGEIELSRTFCGALDGGQSAWRDAYKAHLGLLARQIAYSEH